MVPSEFRELVHLGSELVRPGSEPEMNPKVNQGEPLPLKE